MKGLIWNCRGVGKKGLATYLKDTIAAYEVDFVGLQETMKQEYYDAFFRKIDPLNQFCWKWIPSRGKSGGILGGVKNSKFDIVDTEMGTFYIKMTVMDKKIQTHYCLIFVYGAAQEEHKEDFLQEFAAVCDDQDLPLLIGGDFNILRFSRDKNKRKKTCRYMTLFNSFINTHGLREIEMAGDQYTWSNNHDVPTLEKLDRVLVSQNWEILFPLMTVHKLVREISDHNPLVLDTMEQVEKTVKPFRYDSGWIKQPGFLDKIQTIWSERVHNSDSLGVVQEKLKRVKKKMKGWGINTRSSSRIKKTWRRNCWI